MFGDERRIDLKDGEPVVRLLRPRSIAILGASRREAGFGWRLMRSLMSNGYAGAVVPINPNYDEINGVTCYPDLASLPDRPDNIAFAIADDKIEQNLQMAADIGIPSATIFGRCYTSGQPGEPDLTERLSTIARQANMAICGGNCMGFVNVVDRVALSANPPPMSKAAGNIGLISHSGSSWSGILGNQRGLCFNYAVSAGQETGTSIGDYIRFLGDQPETRVVGCILEVVRDPDNFFAAVQYAGERGVPVVVLKVGRSELGRKFAMAHSGAITGTYDLFEAAMARHNVISTNTIEEFEDTLAAFSSPRRPVGQQLGVVTDSGGERQYIVDTADAVGVPIADFDAPTQNALQAILDPGMTPENPVDSYGDGRICMEECLHILAKSVSVDIPVLATNLVEGRSYAKTTFDILERVQAETSKPVFLMSNVPSSTSQMFSEKLMGIGVPVLRGTASGLLALRNFSSWTPNQVRSHISTKFEEADIPSAGKSKRVMSAPEASTLLAQLGLPYPRQEFVMKEDDAIAAANSIGFPVVMKTANPDIAHKTEVGGVILGISDASEAAESYRSIASRCGPIVEVAAQVNGEVELIVGMTSDPAFGPAVTVGLGGIWTELMSDTITFLPPTDTIEIAEMLCKLKAYPLLIGYRGAPPVNLEKLHALIKTFSDFCATHGDRFREIDLNPVKVGADRATILDTLFVLRGKTELEKET